MVLKTFRNSHIDVEVSQCLRFSSLPVEVFIKCGVISVLHDISQQLTLPPVRRNINNLLGHA